LGGICHLLGLFSGFSLGSGFVLLELSVFEVLFKLISILVDFSVESCNHFSIVICLRSVGFLLFVVLQLLVFIIKCPQLILYFILGSFEFLLLLLELINEALEFLLFRTSLVLFDPVHVVLLDFFSSALADITDSRESPNLLVIIGNLGLVGKSLAYILQALDLSLGIHLFLNCSVILGLQSLEFLLELATFFSLLSGQEHVLDLCFRLCNIGFQVGVPRL
jgi:hypothetical protein